MDQRHDLEVIVRPRLATLAPAWDALVDRLPLPSPFLRSWWLEATAGPRPRFVTVMDGEVLLGGLALQQERWLGVPCLRVMGAGPLTPDHLDLVAAPDRADEVVSALAGWLARKGSRVLDLEGVAAGCQVAAALPGSVQRELIDVAPWSALPPDPETYLRERPRNFRATLRKASRRLETESVSHRVGRPGGLDAALERLRYLHDTRWGGRSNFLSSFDQFGAAARAGMARGELVIHELVAGETVVAVVACFEVAGRVSLYQSGRAVEHRWRNAITVLLGKVIEDACRRGLEEVDLLRGGEGYKRNLGSATREVLRLRAANGRFGRLALATLVAAGWGRARVGRWRRRTWAAARRLRLLLGRDLRAPW